MYCQVTRFEWLTDFQEKKQEISEGRAVQCARYFAQNVELEKSTSNKNCRREVSL